MNNKSDVNAITASQAKVTTLDNAMHYFLVFTSVFILLLVLTLLNNALALTANTVTKSCQFDNVVGVTADQTDPNLTNNEDTTGNAEGCLCKCSNHCKGI